jgi:hypothetical protein
MRRRCVELMAERNDMAYYFGERLYYSIAIANSSTRLFGSRETAVYREVNSFSNMCSAQWECRMRRIPARHYSRGPQNLFILPSSCAHLMGSKLCSVRLVLSQQCQESNRDLCGKISIKIWTRYESSGAEGAGGITWHWCDSLPSGGTSETKNDNNLTELCNSNGCHGCGWKINSTCIYARQKVEGHVAIHSPYERKPNKGGQLANRQIKRTAIK